MSVIPDLSSLDSSATTLESHSDELRARVRQLGAAIDAVNWSSPSARAFHQRADELRTALHLCAAQVDHAAGELRRHAATARSRVADLSDALSYAGDALDLVGL